MIDPESASTTSTAFLTAPAVTIWRGFKSCQTISTMRAPAARAFAIIFGLIAATGALPGSVMPSASQTVCIELAVPMPAHTPGVRTAASAMPDSSSSVIRPEAT